MSSRSITNDYDEAVRGARCLPLADWTTVQVAGRDRATFLHNMCTNDIRSLAPGGGCEAFFTDVKGKIVAHAFVLVGDEAIQLVMVPDSAARLIAHLDRYIIREDVQLDDVSPTVAWTLMCGSSAAEKIGGFHWRSGSSQAIALPDSCDPETWHAIRVESAWPLWGVDFNDANLPQEVGRDESAIHFRKGCYLGQETVARIDALGHVNKRLVQVRFTGEVVPPPGAELKRGDRAVGRVTSSCWSPGIKAPLALAMVQRGSNDIGAMMDCNGQTAEVIDRQNDGSV